MTAATPPRTGASVDYHGTLTEDHGLYRILDGCECAACDADDELRMQWRIPVTVADLRYVLISGERELSHVRLASFTVVGA